LIPRLEALALLSSLRLLIAGITAVAFPTTFTPEPLPLSTLGNYTLLLFRERHRVEVEDGRVRVSSRASLGRRASPRRRGATGTTWSLTGRWHPASLESFFVAVSSSSSSRRSPFGWDEGRFGFEVLFIVQGEGVLS
jgi:hypothetical protein